MFKKMLAAILGVSGILLIVSALIPPPEQYQAIKDLPVYDMSDIQKNSKDKKEPMIALYRPDRKGRMQFHCTAFVISDKLALTAAHCLEESNWEMIKDDITVRDDQLKDTGVIAHAAAINIRADMGAITGDFSKFNKLALNLHPGGFYGLHGPFLSCGFAWGAGPGVCLQFHPVKNYYFQEQGDGRLYPGMSGGPTLDVPTGMVAGINTEAIDGQVVVAPTTGILGALELQVKSP